MIRRTLTLALALLVVASASGQLSSEPPALTPDGLYLIPEGVRAYQISSFDRSGGNDDGNRRWAYLDFSRSNRTFTIFDAVGPGRLTRFWMTGWRNPDMLDFLVDSTPPVSIEVNDIFAGTVHPFVAPAAGDEAVSSGGFYSYVPVDYDSSLTIETSSVSQYIQLQYYRFADSAARVREDARTSLIPADRVTFADLAEAEVTLVSGRTTNVGRLEGPGLLAELSISLQTSHIRAETMVDVVLDDIYLTVTADAADVAQVRTPLSELAAGSLRGEGVSSAVSRVSSDGERTTIDFSLPMPFATGLEIDLENHTGGSVGPVSVTMRYRSVPEVAPLLNDGTIGYLYAQHRREADFVQGRDVELLNWRGAGRIVGVVLVVSSEDAQNRRILEGDDRVYIDGSLTPQIHGTGTEDFFNGGWYYKFGTFTLPTHGHPSHIVDDYGDHTSQYRFLLTDSVPFLESVRMTMEHGPVNDLPGTFSSTVFFYGVRGSRLSSVRTIAADELARAADLAVSELAAPLVGTDDPTERSFHAATIEEPITIQVNLPESPNGLLISRLTDYTIGNQRADIYVNGEYAGQWLTPGFVSDPGILSTEFLVSSRLTAGRRSLSIEIAPAGPFSVAELGVRAVR